MIFENEYACKFIYLKEYLLHYFYDHPIRIIEQHPIDLSDLTKKPWSYYVSVNDKNTEGNMRLMESYLPETLYYLMSYSDNQTTLRSVIKHVCKVDKKRMPTTQPQYYLERRIHYLFEAILFGEFINNVWKGQWLRDRCYVIKLNDELKYYPNYYTHDLIQMLLDSLSFDPIKFTENGKIGYEVSFAFLKDKN